MHLCLPPKIDSLILSTISVPFTLPRRERYRAQPQLIVVTEIFNAHELHYASLLLGMVADVEAVKCDAYPTLNT